MCLRYMRVRLQLAFHDSVYQCPMRIRLGARRSIRAAQYFLDGTPPQDVVGDMFLAQAGLSPGHKDHFSNAHKRWEDPFVRTRKVQGGF